MGVQIQRWKSPFQKLRGRGKGLDKSFVSSQVTSIVHCRTELTVSMIVRNIIWMFVSDIHNRWMRIQSFGLSISFDLSKPVSELPCTYLQILDIILPILYIGRVQFQFKVYQAMWLIYSNRQMANLFVNSGDLDHIGRCTLWGLIWVCTVCQLPIWRSPDKNGLIILSEI